MDSMKGETFGTHASDNASAPPLSADGDPTASKPLRRACDCCRKRKVKCDGGEPCGPCKKATIRCAYLQPPKKKGPKGLRSARVLHALRRIDDTASGAPTSPLSPEHSSFGNWDWNQPNNTANGVHYPERMAQQQHDVMYGPHTSVPPDQTYFTQMPTSMPTAQATQPQQYAKDPYSSAWRSETISAGSDIPPMLSPSISATFSDASSTRLPGESFTPYIELFFTHMFPIMPIIDRTVYLNPTYYANSAMWTAEEYSFLCSICAATIVQLDDSIAKPAPIYPGKPTDDVFAEACLRERKRFDYLERLSTLSIMTSFFTFAYYGNHTQPGKAWYYLQEAITFAETLELDQEETYKQLNPVEAQWQRRLYWLLFITERAYAVQSKKHTRLTPSIQLPEIFDSEEPILLGGFVSLANLFSAVDDNFVRAWRGSRKASLCNEAWFVQTQERLDKAALAIGHLSETQHLDISVTKEWLHVLTWQVGVRNGLIWGEGKGGMRLDYPIELAKKVVEITSGANALALDSHGIGMVSLPIQINQLAHVNTDLTHPGTKTLRHRQLPRRRLKLHHRRHVGEMVQRLPIPRHPPPTPLLHARQRIPLPQTSRNEIRQTARGVGVEQYPHHLPADGSASVVCPAAFPRP